MPCRWLSASTSRPLSRLLQFRLTPFTVRSFLVRDRGSTRDMLSSGTTVISRGFIDNGGKEESFVGAATEADNGESESTAPVCLSGDIIPVVDFSFPRVMVSGLIVAGSVDLFVVIAVRGAEGG